MLLETFDKELYERDLRENIRAEVKKEIRAEVEKEVKAEIREDQMLELIRCKLAKGKSIEEIADALEKDIETIKRLMKEL